jgi:SAM-dependent methyltransferase
MTSLIGQLRRPRLRDYWVRLALRGVHYASHAGKLNALYMVENPWKMDSAKEQARFAWTDQLIANQLSPLDTILEIGCGEGHQSQHLSHLCRQLYGVDVSLRAVRRAQQRCPAGKFAAGDPFELNFADMPRPVDLVAACEVLYYVEDVRGFVQRISRLGKACLVTYYQGQAPMLDPHFVAIANCRREQFRFEGTEWTAVWWRNSVSR